MLEQQAPEVPLIALVGLMGAGKTTVGKEFARRRGLSFVDCDHELEARLGVKVATIFEIEGEAGFRRRETQLLDELTQQNGLVLATGGGAVLEADNRSFLHQRALVVYLNVPPRLLWERTRHDKGRPLLQVPNPREKIEALFKQRDPLYREVAHIVIEGGRGNATGMVRLLDHAVEDYLATHAHTQRSPG